MHLYLSAFRFLCLQGSWTASFFFYHKVPHRQWWRGWNRDGIYTKVTLGPWLIKQSNTKRRKSRNINTSTNSIFLLSCITKKWTFLVLLSFEDLIVSALVLLLEWLCPRVFTMVLKKGRMNLNWYICVHSHIHTHSKDPHIHGAHSLVMITVSKKEFRKRYLLYLIEASVNRYVYVGVCVSLCLMYVSLWIYIFVSLNFSVHALTFSWDLFLALMAEKCPMKMFP